MHTYTSESLYMIEIESMYVHTYSTYISDIRSTELTSQYIIVFSSSSSSTSGPRVTMTMVDKLVQLPSKVLPFPLFGWIMLLQQIIPPCSNNNGFFCSNLKSTLDLFSILFFLPILAFSSQLSALFSLSLSLCLLDLYPTIWPYLQHSPIISGDQLFLPSGSTSRQQQACWSTAGVRTAQSRIDVDPLTV